jgi:hypothetical protein
MLLIQAVGEPSSPRRGARWGGEVVIEVTPRPS